MLTAGQLQHIVPLTIHNSPLSTIYRYHCVSNATCDAYYLRHLSPLNVKYFVCIRTVGQCFNFCSDNVHILAKVVDVPIVFFFLLNLMS